MSVQRKFLAEMHRFLVTTNNFYVYAPTFASWDVATTLFLKLKQRNVCTNDIVRRPVPNIPDSAAKSSSNRAFCTHLLRLIFDDSWNRSKGVSAELVSNVQPLMSFVIAVILPKEQSIKILTPSKNNQKIASTQRKGSLPPQLLVKDARQPMTMNNNNAATLAEPSNLHFCKSLKTLWPKLCFPKVKFSCRHCRILVRDPCQQGATRRS